MTGIRVLLFWKASRSQIGGLALRVVIVPVFVSGVVSRYRDRMESVLRIYVLFKRGWIWLSVLRLRI